MAKSPTQNPSLFLQDTHNVVNDIMNSMNENKYIYLNNILIMM